MKQYNFRLDERLVMEATDLAKMYDETLTDIVKEGLLKVINERKNDTYYRLTSSIKKATKEESKEIMDELSKLSNDDLKVVKTEKLKIYDK